MSASTASLNPAQPENPDLVTYCNCMEEVRHRVGIIYAVHCGQVSTGDSGIDVEIMFMQFRKVLELIAFASLTANKAEYSAQFEKFSTHWNAERMLRDLEKVNPDFYPVSLQPFNQTPDGVKHFPATADGFLTKDEFVSLYDKCGKVQHARNPFSTEAIPQSEYTVQEWVSRIKTLLRVHLMRLVNGDKWVVVIPISGEVQACSGTPVAPT
jgi:hypothetical protein